MNFVGALAAFGSNFDCYDVPVIVLHSWTWLSTSSSLHGEEAQEAHPHIAGEHNCFKCFEPCRGLVMWVERVEPAATEEAVMLIRKAHVKLGTEVQKDVPWKYELWTVNQKLSLFRCPSTH